MTDKVELHVVYGTRHADQSTALSGSTTPLICWRLRLLRRASGPGTPQRDRLYSRPFVLPLFLSSSWSACSRKKAKLPAC
jgi:hypothetical protein